jgi:transposase
MSVSATQSGSGESPMHYVGLDVHQSRSSICILDANGKQVKQFQVRGRWPQLIEEFSKLPRPFSVCYEASCGYGYLHEKLSPMATSVTVAHPGQLRLIYNSKKKNDRVDAAKLAKLLYVDMVPQVHVPHANVRAWRGLIVYRHRLLDRRVGVKNQLRGLLRGLGITAPAGKRLWSRKGLNWLKEQWLDELAALQRDMATDELEQLNLKIRRVDQQLNKIADANPAVTLLRTIPGVGVRTAESIVAYIDDIKRFSRNKKLGSYFGLVPCQDQSAGKNRLGHITREGPAVVRKMLCEATWRGVRCSPAIKAYFERIVGNDPDRRKIALVATAHHLLRVMGAMMRTGEVWQEPMSCLQPSPPEDTRPPSRAVSSVGVNMGQ